MRQEKPADVAGTVVEVLAQSTFRVRLDNDALVVAYAAGKTRKSLLKTAAGDRVFVQLAADGAGRGRIVG